MYFYSRINITLSNFLPHTILDLKENTLLKHQDLWSEVHLEHGKCVEKFDLNHILSPVHSCLRIVTSSPNVLWSEVHLEQGTMCLMLERVVIKITSAPHNS